MSTSFNKTKNPAVLFAVSLGPDVRNWLINTRTARILHIFDRVCNLTNEHGEVISLVSREIGNGPFNLVFSEQSSGPLFSQFSTSKPISVSWPGLRIGDVLIDVRQAMFWSAELDWSGLANTRSLIVSNLLQHMKWLIKEANQDSLLAVLSHADQVPDLRSEPYTENSYITDLGGSRTNPITAWMHRLFEAVHSCDLVGCRKASQQLAGLGVGLTPAGDDFLIGAIYAARIIHPNERATLIASSIACAAIPRTTSLSAAWMRAAARGLANETWLDFLASSASEAHDLTETSLRRLVAAGHTSGADALAGFIGCLIQDMAPRGYKLQAAHQNEPELRIPSFTVPLWD